MDIPMAIGVPGREISPPETKVLIKPEGEVLPFQTSTANRPISRVLHLLTDRPIRRPDPRETED